MRLSKKNNLKNVKLDEVSLVDVPANSKARAVFFKRNDAASLLKNFTDAQREQFQDLLKKGRNEEEAIEIVRGQMQKSTEGEKAMDIEELQAKLAELETNSGVFEKRAEAAEAAVATLSKSLEDNGFDVVKSEEGEYTVNKRAVEEMIDFEGEQVAKSAIPAPILKRLEAQAAELDAVKKSQEKEVLNKRAEEAFPNLAGSADNKGALLKALEGISDESDRDAVEKALKAADAAVSKLFEETGEHADSNSDSASARLDKMVDGYMVEKGVSRAVAFSEVTKSGDGKKLMIETRTESK